MACSQHGWAQDKGVAELYLACTSLPETSVSAPTDTKADWAPKS